ncbi:PREDICTED: ADP-ribosylation factor-like protein 6-interacting protein 4 isoform X2 [Acropora digitifera]|uniref:ADP-ribosylation factor-like protein 6-interacting protein 4 isoform X2 n=1 Tax=Acropora digitifera TaxID=70779 RepID=UPI00077A003A|nr:PREDICTED: ADP-ribosylation factor-like protein 6-interacting protein 4 isoform X2 [Acropora digitifera]
MDMDKRVDKKRKYSSYEENLRTTDMKKRKKSRNYSDSSSSSDSESEHSSSERGKKKKKKKRKDRDKTKSNRKKEKRKKKREKKSKKQKEREEKKAAAIKNIKDKDKLTTVASQDSYLAVSALKKQPASSDSGTSAPPKKRFMVPMTKEEYEKQQAQVKRVYDPETGRHRLVKGTGEILEEIVSKARHNSINKNATRGDGEFFQARLGLQDK